MRSHNLPLLFLGGWLVLEIGPAFVSPWLGDEAYSFLYFLTEDWASVCALAALYFGLSYTSTILKLAAFLALCVSVLFACMNLFINLDSGAWQFGVVVATMVLGAVLFAARFSFFPRTNIQPEHNHIYLVIRKPHSIVDLMALIYSGVGGGFVAYHNGDIWKFGRSAGKLIKRHDPKYYAGKSMIVCGRSTPEMVADLDELIGAKWSIFNNCFTVFAGWRRKWRV